MGDNWRVEPEPEYAARNGECSVVQSGRPIAKRAKVASVRSGDKLTVHYDDGSSVTHNLLPLEVAWHLIAEVRDYYSTHPAAQWVLAEIDAWVDWKLSNEPEEWSQAATLWQLYQKVGRGLKRYARYHAGRSVSLEALAETVVQEGGSADIDTALSAAWDALSSGSEGLAADPSEVYESDTELIDSLVAKHGAELLDRIYSALLDHPSRRVQLVAELVADDLVDLAFDRGAVRGSVHPRNYGDSTTAAERLNVTRSALNRAFAAAAAVVTEVCADLADAHGIDGPLSEKERRQAAYHAAAWRKRAAGG